MDWGMPILETNGLFQVLKAHVLGWNCRVIPNAERACRSAVDGMPLPCLMLQPEASRTVRCRWLRRNQMGDDVSPSEVPSGFRSADYNGSGERQEFRDRENDDWGCR